MNPRTPRPARSGRARALWALACAAGILIAARAADGATADTTKSPTTASKTATPTVSKAATTTAKTTSTTAKAAPTATTTSTATTQAATTATPAAATPSKTGTGAAATTQATTTPTAPGASAGKDAVSAKPATAKTPAGSHSTRTRKAAASASARTAAADSLEGSDRLKGGQEGTVFRNLTIEGEDRVHFEFDRPELAVSLDPSKAPGLEWGSARDVLDRTVPDAMGPMMQVSARQPMPYLGRPWLSGFTSGAIARFRPVVEDVDRWKLTVADSRGHAIRTFSGRGAPPKDLSWDGRSADGSPVTPGLTYSYVFEAFDRAGNKRNIVGKGFTVSAYRIDTADGPILSFCGDSLWTAPAGPDARADAARTPDLLLEAASWVNQSGRPNQAVRVTTVARSRDQAEALASQVMRGLAPLLPGGATRMKSVSVVQPDAPGGGTVTIAPAR